MFKLTLLLLLLNINERESDCSRLLQKERTIDSKRNTITVGTNKDLFKDLILYKYIRKDSVTTYYLSTFTYSQSPIPTKDIYIYFTDKEYIKDVQGQVYSKFEPNPGRYHLSGWTTITQDYLDLLLSKQIDRIQLSSSTVYLPLETSREFRRAVNCLITTNK